jgi:tetrahydromethanopterin S-methyltransferase subunit A
MKSQQSRIDDAYVARHRLLAGSPDAPVAVCALWKDLSKVSFSPEYLERLAVVGNLYTLRGVSLLLRGLWLMPGIRHLVLWGPDTQHTGRALSTLWNDGLSADHRIAGTDIAVDPALPARAIDHLRQHVHLYDYRSARELPALMALIGQLELLPAHAEPQSFPTTEPEQPGLACSTSSRALA